MEPTTIILGVILAIVIFAFLDLNKRNKNNTEKFERLFRSTQSTLEQVLQERVLEKALAAEKEEQLKAEIIEEIEEDLDDRYEQKYAEEDEVIENIPVVEMKEVPSPAASIFGQHYKVDFENIYYMPCLDNQELPVSYKLAPEVVPAVREEFGLPEDNSRLVSYESIKKFIAEHEVKITIVYPKNLKQPINLDAIGMSVPKMTHEEQIQLRNEALAKSVDGTTNNRLLIRYRDGETITFKECANLNLYQSYIKKFGNIGMAELEKLPTGEQFVDWYNQAIDDYAKMNEVPVTEFNYGTMGSFKGV